jgi:hypothetical protein
MPRITCLQLLLPRCHFVISSGTLHHHLKKEFAVATSKLTPYFVVCPLFAVADINKVKTGLGLGKAERKVFQIAFAAQAAVAAHSLAKTGQIGIDLGDNLNVAGMAAALFEDSSSQGVCCLFAAIDALPDEGLFELDTTC